ncbi:hypothetical protein BDV19DRAFT_371449 [Aspergillus venezuelensis]
MSINRRRIPSPSQQRGLVFPGLFCLHRAPAEGASWSKLPSGLHDLAKAQTNGQSQGNTQGEASAQGQTWAQGETAQVQEYPRSSIQESNRYNSLYSLHIIPGAPIYHPIYHPIYPSPAKERPQATYLALARGMMVCPQHAAHRPDTLGTY